MSGIAGILTFDDRPGDAEGVAAMTDLMPHRGPDGITFWSGPGAALAHCKLATTPEAIGERQPLTNEDASVVLVMDGRLDNRDDVRQLLDGASVHVRDDNDAELVLATYNRWGADCAERLEGDYAFVVWDARQRRAFCVRDAAGAKPFVYHWDGRRLIFGSEIRPVLERTASPHRLNEGFLAEALAASFMSRDETFWEGVMRLPAGHAMVVDANGPRLSRHWRPEEIAVDPETNEDAQVERYLATFTETVRRLSRAIGPLGCEVSGGLDSSSIFVVADKLEREGQLGADGLRGLTLKFDKSSRAYELDYVQDVALKTEREIHEIPPALAPFAWYSERSAELATFWNMPHGYNHMNEYRDLHAAGGRVLLNGVGGDQLLSSVDYDLAEAIQTRDWRGLQRMMGRDVGVFGAPRLAWRVVRHGLLPLLPDRARLAIRRVTGKSTQISNDGSFWLTPSMRRIFEERRRTWIAERRSRLRGARIGLARRINSLESGYTALATEMLERMDNQAGIENRTPFFNKGYMALVLALPMHRLRSGRVNRLVHRRAMTGLLPERVANRISKAQFGEVAQPCIEGFPLLQLDAEEYFAKWVDPALFRYVQAKAERLITSDDALPFYMLLAFTMSRAICSSEVEA